MSTKTTVYLPEDLKRDLEREARTRGCSEAQVIRDAVAEAVSRPHPRAGLISGEAIAERVDDLLTGFGQR